VQESPENVRELLCRDCAVGLLTTRWILRFLIRLLKCFRAGLVNGKLLISHSIRNE
jgi:hypothetical protein